MTFGDSSTDAFCVALAKSCPSLQELHIGYCMATDVTLVALAAHCKALHTVDVYSRYLTAAGFETLTAGCCLRKIFLECAFMHTLRASNIRTIARNCPQLQSLWLSSPGELSNEWLMAIADHCPCVGMLRLEKLMLSESASGLLAVAQKCRQLRKLYIDCHELDAGSNFCAAIGHCTKLKHFDLNNPISDALMYELSRCANLQFVNLSGRTFDDSTVVHTITDSSIVALARGCPALTTLWLSELLEVTMDVMRALSRFCPGLVFLSGNLRGILERHRSEISLLLPKCKLEDRMDSKETHWELEW